MGSFSLCSLNTGAALQKKQLAVTLEVKNDELQLFIAVIEAISSAEKEDFYQKSNSVQTLSLHF